MHHRRGEAPVSVYGAAVNGNRRSWRLDVARDAARLYAQNAKVAAVAAAGSVGAGIDDEWSDLELDVYWHSDPTDSDRRAPIDALSGAVEHYWEYSPDEEEWGEEYRVGDLSIGGSSFLVVSAERFLERVVAHGDPSTNAQMRVAALASCVPLHGHALLERWREEAAVYPEPLRVRMVQRYLAPDRIEGWHLREALVERGDDLALHDLLVRGTRAVLGALHGLNRVLLSNPRMKWEQQLIARFEIAPTRLRERLHAVWTGSSRERVLALEALLDDTINLAATHLDVDMQEMRQALERRRPRLTQ